MMAQRPIARRLFVSIVTTLLALVAAEGGYRLWLRSTGVAWDRSRVEGELEEIRAQVLGEREWEAAEQDPAQDKPKGPDWIVSPYVGFDSDSTSRNIAMHLAAQSEAGPEDWTLMILGGSVAGNFSFLGRERLLEELKRDSRLAGRELHVINYARAAHKQPQQVMQAAYLFALGLKPDAVVNLDGFNELAVAARNANEGVHPALPSAGQWLALLSDRAMDSGSLELSARVLLRRDQLLESLEGLRGSARLSSALLGSYALGGLARERGRYALAVDAMVAGRSEAESMEGSLGPVVEGDAQALLAGCVSLWSESSISLAGLCRERGIAYAHVLQPTLHDAGSKPLTEGERATGKAPRVWSDAARDGYPLLRAAGEELRARGVGFYDASGVFLGVEAQVYYDPCHFRKPGHELLAEVVARAVLAEME